MTPSSIRGLWQSSIDVILVNQVNTSSRDGIVSPQSYHVDKDLVDQPYYPVDREAAKASRRQVRQQRENHPCSHGCPSGAFLFELER